VLILPVEGDAVLVSDSAEYRKDLSTVDEVRIGLNLPALTASVLKELGLQRAPLGLVGRESLLLSSYELLCDALGTTPTLTSCDDILAGLRMIKSPAELDLMRVAAEIGAQTMGAMFDAVRAGNTEGDVAGEGWRTAARRGAFPYDTAMTSGPRSAQFQWARLPSWDHRRPLEQGELIHIDLYGPAIEGYWTDFVRSGVVGGAPNAAQKSLLEGSIEHVQTLIAAIRPGITFGDLWRVGDAWRNANGFAAGPLDAMFPAFGHCIGLGGSEAPFITNGATALVEENMVIAVETLLSVPDVGGAGFEQDVIVTRTGCEVITEACPARRW
jgi:Xaa-Pro dipeptidase